MNYKAIAIHHIGKNYNSDGLLSEKNDDDCIFNKYTSMSVIYCENCYKMSPLYQCVRLDDNFQIENLEPLMEDSNLISLKGGSLLEMFEDAILHDYQTMKYMRAYMDEHHLPFLKYPEEDEDDVLLYCPKCGKRIYKDRIKSIGKGKSWISDNMVYDYCKIEEEDDKVVMNIFTSTAFPNTDHGKLKLMKVNTRLVLNQKTGEAYSFCPIDIFTETKLSKQKMCNVTYNLVGLGYGGVLDDATVFSLLSKETRTTLYAYLCSKYGDEPDESTLSSIGDVIIYFRYHKLSSDTRCIIHNLCNRKNLTRSQRQKRKLILQQLYLMQNDVNVIYTEMKKKKCPFKKNLKKSIFNNPYIIYVYRFLIKIGFKDYNVIMSIINSELKVHILLISLYLGFEFNSNGKIMYMKECVASSDDTLAKRYLFKELELDKSKDSGNYISLLGDTVNSYSYIKCALEPDEKFPVKLTDLREMHDVLARLAKKYLHKNQKIPYMKKVMQLNSNINGMLFRLAPDTHSLIDCGEQMGICVGGYDKIALKGDSIIVFAIKEDKYFGCIELKTKHKDKTTLIQAKTKFNHLFYGEEAMILKQWVEENEIDVTGCNDYSHILQNNLDCSKNDWGGGNYASHYDIDMDDWTLDFDNYLVMDN